MDVKRFDTGARMSRVVVHNNVAYFCGHVAAPDKVGIKEQTSALLARYEELLEKFGSDKDHILMATIYMKDIGMINEMNEVWDKWINPGHAPARACVEAKMAEDYILLEIVMTAAIK